MKRVLVVGLDGATFDLIKPWVEEGELPTFKKLIDGGSHGNLKSTIPPVSAPAWTSFMTGKNPGKHGIFDFRYWNPKKYDESSLVNSTSIKEPKIWEILNSFGKKVGVINLPLTYPPQKLNGFMITGMLTPPGSKNYTYPRELMEKLEDYKIDVEFDKKSFLPSFGKINKEKFAKELIDMTESRLKNTLKLMKQDWDLLIVIFRSLDSAQHFFWGDETYLKKFYKKLDGALEKLLKATKNTRMIVMSDHGFGPKAYKSVHINDWLKEHGYLSVKRGVGRVNKRKIASILNSLGLLGVVWKILPNKFKEKTMHEYENVDWSKTKAYFSPKHFAFPWIGIEINLKGKKEMGIVSKKEYRALRKDIIEKLKELSDEKTGMKIIEEIYTKEELYSGKHLNEASDIILKFRFPYRGEKSLGSSSLITLSLPTNIKGEHNINGIFIAYGPGIKRGKVIKNAEIIDIAPTVLHMFGLPVPKDMDGKILKEIFE